MELIGKCIQVSNNRLILFLGLLKIVKKFTLHIMRQKV